MVQQAVDQQATSAFPHPTEALKYGWTFFTTNIWSVVIYLGLSAALGASVTPFVNNINDDASTGTVLVNALIAFAIVMVGLVIELGLWRRVLDYWDETHGLAAPRSTSEAFSSAFEGAKPRFWPYVGWALALAAIVVGGALLGIAIAAALGPLGAILVLLLTVVLFYVFDFLTAFFSIAVADGPDNPISRSLHVFRHHFWRIVGTYLLLGIILVAGVIPLAILLLIFEDSSIDSVIGVIGAAILAVIFLGIGVGAKGIMYRSVYGSPNATK